MADATTGRVAVSLRNPDVLALVDTRRRRVVRRVPIPESARHLSLVAPGGPVLVPSERANTLAQVALPSGRVTPTRVGNYPHDAIAAGGKIFVGDERGSTVTVLEGHRVVKTFRVALQPGGLASIDEGRKVAVVSVRERVLEIYDTRTFKRLGRVDAGVGPTHVVANDRDTLWVTDTSGDALLVFTTTPKLQLIRRYALLGAPYGIGVDRRPEHARLWVTLTRTNELLELSTGDRPRELRRYPAVRQPDTVAVDQSNGRVYVTGTADGVLQVLDPVLTDR